MKSDFLGAVIAISASIGSNLGVNVQKRSHDKEEKKPKHLQRAYTKRPVWWLGMFLVVFGSVGDLLALGFAPQTVVASLGGGSTIVANVLFAHFWLKQALYLTDILGVILVSTGVVVLALSSSEEGKYSVAQLFELMHAPAFIVYVVCTTVLVTFLMLRVRRSTSPALRVVDVTEEVRKKELTDLENSIKDAAADEKSPTDSTGTSKSSEQLSPFPSPVVDMSEDKGLIPESSKGEKNLVSQKHSLVIDKHLPLYWAAISGTLGAQSVLLAKCVMELINMSISGENQFIYPGTWLLLAGMVTCLLSQTHCLNKATMLGDTMSAFPVFQAFWIGMSNISGIVYFQQAHSFNSTQWVMFPTALVLVIVGIVLIAKHEKMGNNTKYSIAMPVQLSSPRQHDIVAQSFLFTESTPQQEQARLCVPVPYDDIDLSEDGLSDAPY